MKKMMAGIVAMALGAAHNTIPSKQNDSSKPATLTPKAWKKRKRKLQITKRSRKANRK